MTTFTRTPRYVAAINELADAIAAMPIKELAECFVDISVAEDVEAALYERHRKFSTRLESATSAASIRWLAKRRSDGARKAAATRAKRRAASQSTSA